jgi:homoserine O-acetyltransferase
MDYFDLSGEKLVTEGDESETRFMVIGFKSDWLYPLYQSREIVNQLKYRRVGVTYCEIPSTYGHDAFLLEVDEQTHLITHFLSSVYRGKQRA